MSLVYLSEGESDALALIEVGLESLHSKSGPSSAVVAAPGTSFKGDWGPLFRGKDVVLCFDSDEAGRKAVQRVAGILQSYAKSVSALQWKAEVAA